MTRRYLLAAIAWLCLVSYALAEDAPSSVLALSVGPGVVDRDALRRSLEAELGVVVEDAGNAPAYMPTLSVVTLPNGNTEVALASRTIPRSTREFLLSAQLPEERVEMVTLIAANLIRNEAAALLPELKPKPAPATPPPPPPPPPTPPSAMIDPCRTNPPREFGIDLAPGVGASSQQRGRLATRAVSLSFAGSLYDRLHGVEISYTGANIVRKSVCGVQFSAGGANVSWGPVVGTQLGIFNLTKGWLKGPQLAIANVTIGDMHGAQLGVVGIDHGTLVGVQLGVANYVGRDLVGLQAGVVNLALKETTGAQLGVANYAGSLHGLQASVVNIAIGNVEGAQLGVANFAAKEVRGLQAGVFNYAEKSTASIGLFSIVRRGRTSIDLTGTMDSSLLYASVTHGGKYVHNIIGVGLHAPGDPRLVTLYGLGVRAMSNRWVRLDVDLLTQNVYNSDLANKDPSMVATVRVPLTVMLVRGLGVMIAPSYNFSVIDAKETRKLNNFGSTSLHRGDPNVRSWPGLTLGLRYEFDHGA